MFSSPFVAVCERSYPLNDYLCGGVSIFRGKLHRRDFFYQQNLSRVSKVVWFHWQCVLQRDVFAPFVVVRAVASLQASALDLERRVKDRKKDALKANREGQKMAALVQIRRMKQCQAAWHGRLSALYTLEQALYQV